MSKKITEAERLVEKRLVRTVEDFGGMCIKLESQIGIPDRLCVLPKGIHVFVEAKATGEKPRLAQVKFIAKLRALGHRVEVIDSSAKAVNLIHSLMRGL